MRHVGWWIGSVLSLGVGLLCGGYGFWLAVVNPERQERAVAEAAQLPVITTTGQLRESAPGQRVLLEGQIAPGNPGLTSTGSQGSQNFVIYQLYRVERSTGPNDVRVVNHVNEERVTPPLELHLPDGGTQIVNIVNNDYQFTSFPHGAPVKEDKGVRGFIEGDEIMVDGTVVQGPVRPAIRATFVHSGGRSEYLRYLDLSGPSSDVRGLAISVGWAAICLAVPLLAFGLLLGGWGWWKRRSQRRNEMPA